MSAVKARWSGLLVALLLAISPRGGAGQDVASLAERCDAAGGPTVQCAELAVTAQALQAHVGLLAGFGSEVSGSASTLGRRLGTTPRIALEARASFAKMALPDLADPGPEPSRKASFIVPVVRGGITAGVFDGFQIMPTVGGLFGLDLLAQGSVAFLPTQEGFDAKTSALTVGARLGILRESFTLPGVSVSVSRRWAGTVTYGAPLATGSFVKVDPDVTSVRFTAGKDLLSVGVLAGMGWDRYKGHVEVTAQDDPLSSYAAFASDDFTDTRRLYFAGAAMNFLVLQLSGEVGWAQGFDAVTGYRGAAFDPTSGTWYGSLAFRLTL